MNFRYKIPNKSQFYIFHTKILFFWQEAFKNDFTKSYSRDPWKSMTIITAFFERSSFFTDISKHHKFNFSRINYFFNSLFKFFVYSNFNLCPKN
ncbi:hypothetical protein BpHYR1_003071 [Brachionus plicatilis]|uniref:Uncharacterized protein n=1 Tax=Brachionus plicatilis TaxID=10195 RepID=A0A3M7SET1_BRAPC|nr:hypothetical protein BpHYR1_003071 [Brachionus plicatilis]